MAQGNGKMKITKRQLKQIIKEEHRKLSEDEDWRTSIQKQTSSSHRTSQEQSIADILNQIDELMETAYEIARDMESNEGYINVVSIMQKYFDQAISGNWSYNPLKFDNNEVPLSVMAKDMLTSYKYGWKTVYYQNTYDFKGEEEEVQPAGLSAVVEDDNGEDVELELSNRQVVNGHAKVNTGVDITASSKNDDECDACTI